MKKKIVTIVLLIIFMSLNVIVLEAYNTGIYASKNYGIAQDLRKKGAKWNDFSVDRYSQIKSTRQPDNEAIIEYADGQNITNEVREQAIKKADENYQVAIDNEIGDMHKLLIADVKLKDIEEMSSEELNKYIICLQNYSDNEGLDDLIGSGTATPYVFEAEQRAEEIEEKYADKLSGDQKEQLEEIEKNTEEIIEEDQDQLEENGANDDGHDDEEKENEKEKEYTISGVVIRPGGSSTSGEEIKNPADDPGWYKPDEMGENATLEKLGGIITGALKIVGIITSVLILVILGIKYMTGTIQEKAEYKKSMIPYILGAVFLATGGILIELIYKIVSGLTF